MRGSVPQEGRRVPCRASQLWVPLPWCSPPLRLLHFRAFKQGPGQGSCSLSDEPQMPRASTASPWFPWGWGKPSLLSPSVPKNSTHTPTEVAPWGSTGRRVPSATGGIGHPGWHRGLQVQGTCCPRLREGLSSSNPRVESGSQRPLPAAALPGGWSPRAQGHGVAGAGPRRDWEAALHSPGGKWVLTRAGSVSLQSYDSAGSRACCAGHRPPDGPEG